MAKPQHNKTPEAPVVNAPQGENATPTTPEAQAPAEVKPDGNAPEALPPLPPIRIKAVDKVELLKMLEAAKAEILKTTGKTVIVQNQLTSKVSAFQYFAWLTRLDKEPAKYKAAYAAWMATPSCWPVNMSQLAKFCGLRDETAETVKPAGELEVPDYGD